MLKKIKLEEVAEIRRGASPRPIGDPAYFSDMGRGWVRIADVTSCRTFLTKTTQNLSKLGESKSVAVDDGDLIMSICATIGVSRIVKIPACIHDGFVVIRKFESKIDKLFLYHYLNFLTQKLSNSGQPGTQRNLNITIVGNIEIPDIPLYVQEKIAQILSTWDEAIAITEKLITAKKKLKTALLQKLLTENLRFQQFQFDIWHTVKLGKVAEIRRGASPRPIDNPDYFSESGRGWVRIADVTASKTYLTKTKQYLSQLGESKSVSVDPGDLIMSICATIGIPRIVKMKACIHDGFVVIRSIDKFNKLFLYHFLNFISLKLAGSGQPGTQKNLNTIIVSNIEVPAISVEEQDCIATVISLADDEIYKLEAQLYQIQKQKRGLMQKLLTGKWRVSIE